MKDKSSRREFLCAGSALAASGLLLGSQASVFAGESSPATPPAGFKSLFDGKTLAGWHAMPRAQGKPNKSGNPNSFYERALKSRGK